MHTISPHSILASHHCIRKLNEEVSGNELEAILSACRKGQMLRAELVERLELHSDRYYVAPSAKRAREILIGLEVGPELKAYLVAEQERLETLLMERTS